MSKVLISYRRSDTRVAAIWLAKTLKQSFGKDSIFIDFDGTPPGSDFRTYIRSQLNGADVVIAMIGANWFERDSHGSLRLGKDDDWVRFELAIALAQDILVIPLLVDGTPMPHKLELPHGLEELPFRQAAQLDTQNFEADAALLINTIKTALRSRKPPKNKLRWAAFASLAASITIGSLVYIADLEWYDLTHPSELGIELDNLRAAWKCESGQTGLKYHRLWITTGRKRTFVECTSYPATACAQRKGAYVPRSIRAPICEITTDATP